MALVIQNGVTPDDPLAVFIMGPTATGKTDLAIALVEELPMDIISVDSAMVYRGMDIGSAKPDAATLARAPHRLIDICDPADAYSAGRFRDDALVEMARITASERIPLLVGGTMLYFRALQQGIANLPDADPDIRRRIDDEARRGGWERLHRRLASIDPAFLAQYKKLIDDGYARSFSDGMALEAELSSAANSAVTPEEVEARREAVQARARQQD